MFKQILSDKRKITAIMLAIAGMAGILTAIVVTPDFTARYISSDHHLETGAIEIINYYRLLAFSAGCILLLISVLLRLLSERYFAYPYVFASRIFFVVIFIYLVFFGYNAMTRTHDFGDPDTMNYVDIGRNIATGRGITQSALGFNQSQFSGDGQIPSPLTSQPPLYPVLIAIVSFTGLSYVHSGLLISVLCYGLILLSAYQISDKMYNERAALFSVGLLLLYEPLYYIARTAFSELPGIVFIILSLLALIRIRSNEYSIWMPALAGLLSGLAFATRYAFAPIAPLCVFFILIESKKKLRDCALYITAFTIPAALVLMRNFILSGAVFSYRNPSTVSLKKNIINALKVITTEYTNIINAEIQALVFILIIAITIIFLLIKRKLYSQFLEVIVRKGRYIIILWILGYLTFLIYTRTKVHLDPVNWRFILPSGVMILILLSAWITETAGFSKKYILGFVFIIVFFMLQREALLIPGKPAFDREQVVASSERLQWVVNNTSERDLIIGDRTVDFAFYFDHPSSIAIAPYPEAENPEYEKIIYFCNRHCREYENIYMILHPPDFLISHAPDMEDARPEDSEENLRKAYGPFIADVLYGKLSKYPAVSFLQHLKDAYIYRIKCKSQDI